MIFLYWFYLQTVTFLGTIYYAFKVNLYIFIQYTCKLFLSSSIDNP